MRTLPLDTVSVVSDGDEIGEHRGWIHQDPECRAGTLHFILMAVHAEGLQG